MKQYTLLATLLFIFCQHVAATDLYAADLPIQAQSREVHRAMTRAGISAADADTTVAAMIKARFNERQMNRIGESIRTAPPSAAAAICNKIHEGIAKGVSADTIVAATSAVAARNRTATRLATIVGTQNQSRHAALYADCLAAGLTQDDALQLANALQKRSSRQTRNTDMATQTLLTARDMVRQGVSSGTTSLTLQSALQHRYSAEEMKTLRTRMSQCSGNLENMAHALGEAIANGTRGNGLQNIGSSSGTASQGSGSSGAGSSGSSSSSGSSGSSGSGSSSGGGNGAGGSGAGGGNGGSGGGNGGGGNGRT